MPTWSTEAKNLDDDEWKIYENGTKWQKSTANSRQKSTANSRREEQCQLQAETYEENTVSKKEVGPMTRNKDTESHRRMAAEQARLPRKLENT